MQLGAEGLIEGRFEILRESGRGASGVVYQAVDRSSGAVVALKIIASRLDEQRDRFLEEGRVLSRLDHPNVVKVIAFGVLEDELVTRTAAFQPGTAYVVMEWLDGDDLEAVQRRHPLGLADVLQVVLQVARALGHAHAGGVVHRDVKPTNIFVLKQERDLHGADQGTLRGSLSESGLVVSKAPPNAPAIAVKLLDFGIAAAPTVGEGGTFAVAGTPAYMAPEQAQGDAHVDERSDLYSLGATLFELCAGRPPQTGGTPLSLLARRVAEPAPRLSEVCVDVPEALDDLIARLLEIDPAARPTGADAVVESLAALERSLPSGLDRLLLREADSKARRGVRLVTTMVALGTFGGEMRQSEIARLRELGADALALGPDAIVAHWGTHKTHGDEATRAIDAGASLANRGAKVGIATGKTRIDGNRSTGETVDRAAQLARASRGEVNADSTTGDLARGRAEFDIPSTGPSGAPTARRRAESEPSRFVGREEELALALSTFERSVATSRPMVVSVSGPPGIGKTRLGQEIISRLEHRDPPVRVLWVRCESYGQSQSLGAASDALRSLLKLPKGCDFADSMDALRKVRGDANLSDEELLLARLLANVPFPKHVDPRAARDALYVAMTALVLGALSSEPCTLVIEDAQWADPESIAWIDHLLGRADKKALLALLFVRPTFWRSHPERFASREHVRIQLRPMAKRAVGEIARKMLGPGASDLDVERVADQAAGSPLFAEELARLVAQGKGLTGAVTIESAIQVTLDSLEDQVRDAAVRLSVFGLAGWEAGLEALYDGSSSFTGIIPPHVALRRLIAADLIVESPTSRFPSTREFLFKHALIRDVAYAAMGDDLKKQLHASAARWLESVGEGEATIAQHFDLGGEPESAACHWEVAARRALATNALAEAATMSERALAFAEDKRAGFNRAAILEEANARLDARGGERDAAIQAMRENTFDEASQLRTEGASLRFDDARAMGIDVEERLGQVRDRALGIGLYDEAAKCTATLAQRLAFGGALKDAEVEAERLLGMARDRGLVWASVDAWQTLAVVRQTRGALGHALEARRSAARAARAAGLMEREAILTMNLGFALTSIGARNEALDALLSGIESANSIGSMGAVRHGQMNLLGWSASFGADDRVASQLAEPRQQADEAALGGYLVLDRSTLGVLFYRAVELLRDEGAGVSRARGLLERVAGAYRSTGNLDILPVCLGFWSEAERRVGNADLARNLAGEAADLLDRGAPSLLNEAPVYLALHSASLDLSDLVGARDAIIRSLPHLLRRLHGLQNTPYAHAFLTGLAANVGVVRAAEGYGVLTAELERALPA